MKRFFAMCLMVMMFCSNTALAKEDDFIQILILGTDNLGEVSITETEEMSRADAIFIATLNKGNGNVKLMSIERDYLVELPDDFGMNKLATSSYFGGPDLTIRTINQFFELDLSYYVSIDIESVIKAIDIIGGIDIEIYEDEVDEINSFIDGIMAYFGLNKVTPGMNHLTGPEAWAMLGVRNNEEDAIESNADRNNRQQRVIKACLDKVFTLDISQIIDLVSEIIPLVDTNLSMANILSILNSALNSDLENIAYFRSPHTSYEMRRVDMHRGLMVNDMNLEIEGIHQFLYE